MTRQDAPPPQSSPLAFADALDLSHTGDVWLFRGPALADRAIRMSTNSPVNHVAMVVAIDDLPPLLWHTELGQATLDVWTGDKHRGAQLNLLQEAFPVWTGKYRQAAFVRFFDGEVTKEMEDELLKVVAAYNGRPFPRTRSLSWKWLSGRFRRQANQDAVYCAQLLAITFSHMGLLDAKKPDNWYDPGKFWSGDRLQFEKGASLGEEIAVLP